MSEPMLSRYLHQKAAAAGFPVAGNFELTPRCNFNCKMCYVHLTEAQQQQRGKELTAEQWLSIGESACREGLVFLLLTGGEPTLRPDFMEILSAVSMDATMEKRWDNFRAESFFVGALLWQEVMASTTKLAEKVI